MSLEAKIQEDWKLGTCMYKSCTGMGCTQTTADMETDWEWRMHHVSSWEADIEIKMGIHNLTENMHKFCNTTFQLIFFVDYVCYHF